MAVICSNCGAKNTYLQEYCWKCGTDLKGRTNKSIYIYYYNKGKNKYFPKIRDFSYFIFPFLQGFYNLKFPSWPGKSKDK